MFRCFVVDSDNRPLAPTHRERAFSMVRRGKAEVICKHPLTIRLKKRVPPAEVNKVTELHLHLEGEDRNKLVVYKKDTNEVAYRATVEYPAEDVKKRVGQRKLFRVERRRRRKKRSRRRSSGQDSRRSFLDIYLDWIKSTVHFFAKRCAVEAVRISRNSNFRMLSWHYELTKKLVRALDGNRCFLCNSDRKKLHVHHIIPRSWGGPDSTWNLVTLCSDCHRKIHSKHLLSVRKDVWPLLRAVRPKRVGHLAKTSVSAIDPTAQVVPALEGKTFSCSVSDERSFSALWGKPYDFYVKNPRHRRKVTTYVRQDRVYVDRRTDKEVAWNRRRRWGQPKGKPSLEELVKKYGPEIVSFLKVKYKGGRVGYNSQRDFTRVRRWDIVWHERGGVGVVTATGGGMALGKGASIDLHGKGHFNLSKRNCLIIARRPFVYLKTEGQP